MGACETKRSTGVPTATSGCNPCGMESVETPRDYPHTREYVQVDVAVKRALELDAYMDDVRYKRYDG